MFQSSYFGGASAEELGPYCYIYVCMQGAYNPTVAVIESILSALS